MQGIIKKLLVLIDLIRCADSGFSISTFREFEKQTRWKSLLQSSRSCIVHFEGPPKHMDSLVESNARSESRRELRHDPAIHSQWPCDRPASTADSTRADDR